MLTSTATSEEPLSHLPTGKFNVIPAKLLGVAQCKLALNEKVTFMPLILARFA